MVLWPAVPAQGQGLGEIFDVGASYSEELVAGDEVSFLWLVYNREVGDVLLQLQASPASEADWSARVEPGFVVLRPGDSLNATLVVSAETFVNDRAVAISVIFTLTRASDPLVTETLTRTATVDLKTAPPPIVTGNKILGIIDNPFPPPFNSRLVTFIINMAIWAGIAGVILLVVTPVLRRYTSRTKTDIDAVVLKIVRIPIVVLILVFGVVQSVAVLEPPADVINFLFLVYSVVLLVVLTWLAYRLFQGVLIAFTQQAAKTREIEVLAALLPLISRFGGIIILVAGGAALLALFGYDLTALALGAGVFGLAFAFAAKDSLSNFLSGVFLMTDRPFKVGDLVEIDGDRARVERIGMRTTTLYHRPSHKLLVVPNNKMAGEMVVNLVEPDMAIRQSTKVGVEYGADVETVKTILAEAAADHPGVHKAQSGRQPYARLEDFGDSALIFKLKFWVKNADKANRVRGEVNETIVRRLTEAGIEIPAPMMTVTLEDEEKKQT
ncbi:MAG: mechanosensitive ion channel family protein [Thermoplasmata archaeon]